MVKVVGFEPTTSWSQTRRSDQTELHLVMAPAQGIEPCFTGLESVNIPDKTDVCFHGEGIEPSTSLGPSHRARGYG